MNDFKIGDEVVFQDRPTKFVITNVDKDGSLDGIGANGIAFCDKKPERWSKTGRYFPEAKALMDALNK